MAKIKQKVSINDDEGNQIRRQWVAERARWYFSITDVIGILTESIDARNYWKALKNRLKISQNQLVMDCNQLKMEASDGKSYMVDVADASTIIKIIQLVAPYNIPAFKSYFDHIDVQSEVLMDTSSQHNIPLVTSESQIIDEDENEISTALEPQVDIYENKSNITLIIMLPGADPEKIIISANMHSLTIKGARISQNNSENKNDYSEKYIVQELQWGEFYRKIKLPELIDVDNISAIEFQGLITITLPKIDQNKNRFIKIKSL